MFSVEDVKGAVDETQRFLDRVATVLVRCEDDDAYLLAGSKEAAALRRASLDLTRALADLRRR